MNNPNYIFGAIHGSGMQLIMSVFLFFNHEMFALVNGDICALTPLPLGRFSCAPVMENV